MKRYNNLFNEIFSRENLYAAYLDARKSKRGRRACYLFEQRLGYQLDTLYSQIHSGTYLPQPYYKFTVYEPKKRIIYAPAFRDCVVQHAIYRVVYTIFDRGFIDQSYACRIGKGTHKASDKAQEYLRNSDPDSYVLKMDIKKFFYSINREVLRRQVSRKIKEKRLVDIMMMFAAHNDSSVGIPIGNLLSQLYALVYLNQMDHYIKRTLKAERYIRYVDDFVIFGVTKEDALILRRKIEQFISSELNLSFSKTHISKVRKGINFVGFRTWRGKKFIRKHSLFKYTKMIKRGKIQSAVSILGHAKRTNSLSYLFNITRKHNALLQIPKSCRKWDNVSVCSPKHRR
jgi:retron-type reverse transcriptase